MTTAAEAWAGALAGWALPPEIVDAAPESPWCYPPAVFEWTPERAAAEADATPSRRRALQALPEGGSVLDVGVGGGASSLGLVPRAGFIVGVDRLADMLESFEASALEMGVEARTVLGDWPDVADQVEPADVAVCHHAVYSVARLEEFVTAITARARQRVVFELSERSPLAALNPLWRALHGIDRPDFLVADAFQDVVVSMGLPVEREDVVLPPRAQEVTPETVAFARRRVYVGPERDAEIEEFLRAREPTEQRVAALWWRGAA